MTGRTISTPICPRPIKSVSSTCPSPGTGRCPSTQAGERTIRIHELHMEEDAGKLVHDPWLDQTRADYNRCGVPLIEIVTEPDFRTADEVIAYLEQLKETLQYLGVSDCKMQEGSLRCDVNLSVRPAGSRSLGTRTEMKNLNSFKAIARAIAYEARRQIELLEAGQAGGAGDPALGREQGRHLSPCAPRRTPRTTATSLSRISRPIQLSEDYLERLRAQQPELADAKRARYQADYGLPPYDCHMITSDKALARFFEALVELGTPPKQGANWIMGQVLGALSARGLEPQEMKLTAPTLARLIALVGEGRLNRNTAVKVFEAVFDDDSDVEQYVKAHGLEQIGDEGLVAEVVARVLAANPQSAADYKGGREKAFGFLVGQVMRELKGKADPRVVNALLRRKLAE